MNDKNVDYHRNGIDPKLWHEMKVAAMSQGINIATWLADAIKIKLQEGKNEK